jgi:hypothetical protein
MSRFRAVVLALAALPLAAPAAEVTRIASSFEDNDPFGMFVELGFERTQQKALITHELHMDGAVQDVPELRYLKQDARLNMDLRIGLWKDLELHYGLPLVFQHNESWGDAKRREDQKSSVAANEFNCVQANGELVDPACPTTGAGSRSMMPLGVPGSSVRGGLGDMVFGLAYAFFNETKDDTKPTWIGGFEYQAPTADALDPTLPATNATRGKIGERVHRYKLYTSFSRKMGGVVDPYFHAYWVFPYRGSGSYSNCDHPDPSTMARPENCNTDQWKREVTGITIPQRGGMFFGSEFTFYNEKAKHQQLALDLRVIGDYVGAGRYYNELSGQFGKLLTSGDYFMAGGAVGINANATDYVTIRVHGTLLYTTPHGLTEESQGRDQNGNGTIEFVSNPIEINPNFDFRADAPSRRFRIAEDWTFRIDMNVSINF